MAWHDRLGGLLKFRKPSPMGSMVHAGGSSSVSWIFSDVLGTASDKLPGSKVDFAAKVGDGMGSSVLMAAINFILRTFPEAPPIVERRTKDQWGEDQDHPLTEKLENPNPYYGGRLLWMATVSDFLFGNAYWLKIRNAQGGIAELWWVPRATMKPCRPADGSQYISHYEYNPGSGTVSLPVHDVVHFRYGTDPKNPQLGLSPIASLYRDIYVDDLAASFTASILDKLGIVGVIISPKEGQAKAGAFEETKEYIDKNFTGDKRGSALALARPTDVQLLQYNLQGFDAAPIRDVSEERVCAMLGIPAAVVGFGTGLHQTKVGATMKEMRQLAWTTGIIPLQEMIADEINRSLLPEFTQQPRRDYMRFDTSKVRALWEDTNEKHDRIRKDFQAKLIDRATALREMGRPVKPEDEGVYSAGPSPFNTDTPPKQPPATPADDEDETDAAA